MSPFAEKMANVQPFHLKPDVGLVLEKTVNLENGTQ